MKTLMVTVAAGAIAVTLAACGGANNNNSSTGSSGSSSTTSSILKDASGMALYTPDGESATNVRCTGACVSVWKPLRPGDAKLTNAGKVAAITRPDGSKQLAAAGKPLYTFAQDTPGKATGNGAKDAFGAKQFTWHAVKAGGSTAATPASSGGGYGSSGY